MTQKRRGFAQPNKYQKQTNNKYQRNKQQKGKGEREKEVEETKEFYDDSLTETNFFSNPNQLKKFENVDIYEYELPDNFDDEEIEEEEAFSKDDFLKYGDIGTKRKRGEEEEEDEEEEGGEFTTITDLLDADDASPPSKPSLDSDDDDFESEEEDELKDDDKRKLLSAIDGQPFKKRKLQTEHYDRTNREENEKESEYNLGTKERVDINDLMASLGDTAEFGELKKKLGNLKEQPLSAPLSDLSKNRLLRKVAYEKTTKDVGQWQSTVDINRRADTIDFTEEPLPKPSDKLLVTSFSPEKIYEREEINNKRGKSEFESEIAKILKESGVEEKKIIEYELESREYTLDEIKDRQKEIAKLRSLMFYKEQKLKRQKKIKSKKYRKILRKSKEKQKLSLEELAVVDPDQYQAEIEKKEMERIKERLTLKHSQRTTKWSQRASKLKDLSSKQAIQEQIRLSDELRKKMHTANSDEDEDDDNDDHDDDDDMNDRDNDREEEGEKKGLQSMLFMKRAAQRHEEQRRIDEGEVDDEDESAKDSLPSGRFSFLPSISSKSSSKPSDKPADKPSLKPLRNQTANNNNNNINKNNNGKGDSTSKAINKVNNNNNNNSSNNNNNKSKANGKGGSLHSPSNNDNKGSVDTTPAV